MSTSKRYSILDIKRKEGSYLSGADFRVPKTAVILGGKDTFGPRGSVADTENIEEARIIKGHYSDYFGKERYVIWDNDLDQEVE